jgi:enoyl-CoA hydratase/carnithine racemase
MSGVRIERQGRLAVLRLDKARGNAIDEPLAEELARAAAEVARDAGVRGVLLASAHPKLFCPGLDLVALAGYDRPSMERFMTSFAVTVWALFGLPKPVVAAVSGAAVAGGCILVLTADHRVLKRGAPIGLNEVKVGVPLPWSVTRLLQATVPAPALGRIALLGRNFSDAEAVDLGLAHEIAEAEGFEAACLARLEEFADKDPLALATTKAWLREGALTEMMGHEADRVGAFLDGWFSEGTQERIRATVASLQSRD